MPTLNITLSLTQDEIDSIREAAGSESVASLMARALRRELRARRAAVAMVPVVDIDQAALKDFLDLD